MRGRRNVLASLGTALTLGLAGCGVNAPVDHRNGTATARETPPERSSTPAADAGGLRVTTEETTTDGLDWTVEKQPAATEDQPCELRIAVENTGQSRQLTPAGPTPFPPTRGTRTDGTDQMVHPAIIPVESGYERRFNGDCWQAPLDDPKIADDAPWAGAPETRGPSRSSPAIGWRGATRSSPTGPRSASSGASTDSDGVTNSPGRPTSGPFGSTCPPTIVTRRRRPIQSGYGGGTPRPAVRLAGAHQV